MYRVWITDYRYYLPSIYNTFEHAFTQGRLTGLSFSIQQKDDTDHYRTIGWCDSPHFRWKELERNKVTTTSIIQGLKVVK